ncbi:unnamed protein product [Ophioblennius macclurei]
MSAARVSRLLLFGVFAAFFLLLCLPRSARGAFAFTRNLSAVVNPGYPFTTDPVGDLLHVKAVGPNDTLHYLFSSQGAPTVLLIHTDSTSSDIKVNWTEFLARNASGGLWVEPKNSLLYSTALVFSRLLEYDDVNDTARPNSDFFPPYDLQNFTWSPLNLSGTTPNALLCGGVAQGLLCLQLAVFGEQGRGESWPRLLHSENSSQLEVRLDGITPRSPNSRFLLELQAVGETNPPSRVDIVRSIDDEYTPSIFKVSQWVSSTNGSSDVLGFVQWKPVAYRQSHPVLEDATPAGHSEPLPQSGEAAAFSSALIRAFFAEPQSVGLNMSFGLAGEPFYNSSGFLSWTLLVGIGPPPVETFSSLVIGIMAVGVGMPILFLLMGGVFVCFQKKGGTNAGQDYEPIN